MEAAEEADFRFVDILLGFTYKILILKKGVLAKEERPPSHPTNQPKGFMFYLINIMYLLYKRMHVDNIP